MLKKFILISVLLLGACTHRFAEFGVLSPEVSEVTPQQLTNARLIRKVRGSDSRPIAFIVPLGQPSLETAVNRILVNNEADILVNVKVTAKTEWWFFYGTNTLEVSGDAVKLAPMIEGDFFNE